VTGARGSVTRVRTGGGYAGRGWRTGRPGRARDGRADRFLPVSGIFYGGVLRRHGCARNVSTGRLSV